MNLFESCRSGSFGLKEISDYISRKFYRYNSKRYKNLKIPQGKLARQILSQFIGTAEVTVEIEGITFQSYVLIFTEMRRDVIGHLAGTFMAEAILTVHQTP